MKSARLFLPQEKLDTWTVENLIEIGEQSLSVPGGETGLELEPAVHFTREVSEEGDTHGLVGKVKTHAQLEQMGADHYRDSVLVGETAYEVAEGFVATLPQARAAEEAGQAVEAEPPAEAAPEEEAAPDSGEEEITDADELARLLIEKLD